MEVAAVVIIGTVSFLGLVRYLMSRRRGRQCIETPPMRSRSSVHILRSRDELRDALSRAAHTERGIADTVRVRADRYEALVVPAPVAAIRSERRLTAAPTIERSQLA
jgi:hypothetical protein